MSKNPKETLGQLLEQTQTLQLATLDAVGEPSISYAPFVQDEAGNFYIFVSTLASHTQEILNHPRVAVLLIADEQEARQIFARTRATYRCVAEVVAREATIYPQMLDALEARFVSASSAEQAGALLGFVLQGKAVSQRQAWVAQVSA